MANLIGFVQVPSTATAGGAPIDSFQGDAFRINDNTFNTALSAIAQTPWLRNDAVGGNGLNYPPATAINVGVTDNCTISSTLTATAGVPIIIYATTSITISANIVATGASLPSGSALTEGNVGGSGGGGGTTAGGDIVLPFSKGLLQAGGAVNTAGQTPAASASLFRFFNMLPMMLGGARGGDGGGMGGGIIVLAAPTITLGAGINVIARGAAGVTAGSGGGGGGTILVMCTVFNGFVAADFTGPVGATDKFQINGGAGNGAGGAGGNGLRLLYTMP